jgi:hypothetical protein
MDHRERFEPINDAILETSGELEYVFGGAAYPRWYGHALSDIALILGETGRVELASVRVELGDDDESHTVTIHVFSADIVIRVVGSSVNGSHSRTTTAWPRTDLRALQVSAGESALGNAWPNRWPGRVDLRLSYAGEITVELPGARSVPNRQRARIAEFVPSLRADLAAR